MAPKKARNEEANGQDSSKDDGKVVEVVHTYPNGTTSAFSNHVLVSHTPEGEFNLLFFEMNHPLFIGNEDQRQKQLEKLEKVEAACVAKIVISAERMPKLIAALIQNYESYEGDAEVNTKSTSTKGKKNAS